MKNTVVIPLGTDLNDGLPPTPPEDTVPDFLPMDDDIFEDLPPLLQAACEKLPNRAEQETFLIGAIGMLSGMLPNVEGRYFGRTIGANLYCFVIGKYGTGKGALLWAKDLGEAVDAYREAQTEQRREQHNEEEAQYNRQLRLYEKGKLPEPPTPPKAVRHLKLFLPANSTKTAVMQLLMENDGRGVMFETEGDTLADMLRQDYGNFSDVLRKAFHHEPVSYFRRANNEDVKINHPALSVVLSGTEDQLRRLIPSAENGLFSRFLFYILEGNAPFRNPFDTATQDHEYYFNVLADRFLKMYQHLEQQDEPVRFELSAAQQKEFFTHFSALKEEVSQHVSSDLDGTINRMGLITYRIAMILTCIRFADSLHGTLTCTNTDFQNAIAITRHLLHYSLHVYELLGSKPTTNPLAPITTKKEQIEECCRQHKMGKSLRAIALDVLGDKDKNPTIYNWIKKHCEAG